MIRPGLGTSWRFAHHSAGQSDARISYRSSLTGYTDNPAYANVVFAYDVAPGAGA